MLKQFWRMSELQSADPSILILAHSAKGVGMRLIF